MKKNQPPLKAQRCRYLIQYLAGSMGTDIYNRRGTRINLPFVKFSAFLQDFDPEYVVHLKPAGWGCVGSPGSHQPHIDEA